MSGILQGIRAWEATLSDARYHQMVKQRATREIGQYLGEQAAQRLVQPVAQDGKNLLSTIEPVLAEFLGSRAAFRLVSHVVDAAIVRS